MKNHSLRPVFSILTLVFASISTLCLELRAQAPVPDSPAIEAQAHALLSKLTLEQKIELLGGVDNMYTRPMPTIGLPRFKMSDASVGVRTWGPTTAYASGASLAASWDTDLARKLGEALGRDARARSVNFLLGPGVNIARSPVSGRNFEYLSEDPFLNSAIVVPFIEGVQSARRDCHREALRAQRPGVQSPQRERRRGRAHHARNLSARLRSRRHQGACRCRDELLQPGQRRPRHAKRLPQPESAQGRVGLPGHSHVRLGRDLRRRRRLQSTASIWRCPAPNS